MKRVISINGCGILYSEIILTALQEYRKQCDVDGNHCRADVVNDIINACVFQLD